MEEKYLFNALYDALLEFREDAVLRNDMRTFHICDLLHNLPLQLLNRKSTEERKELYEELSEHANSHPGLKLWLEGVVKQADQREILFKRDQ